jgi:hypothetical protein
LEDYGQNNAENSKQPWQLKCQALEESIGDCEPGRVLDSGGKTPIMKTRSGGFNGEGCGEDNYSVRMVVSAETAKKRQSKEFLEKFHCFFGFTRDD